MLSVGFIRRTASPGLQSHAWILFVVNKPSAKVCEMDLNEENFQSLKYAVDNHYWYQMYIGMYLAIIFTVSAFPTFYSYELVWKILFD